MTFCRLAPRLLLIALVAAVAAWSQVPGGPAAAKSEGAVSVSPEEAAVLDLEKQIGEAIVQGDIAFFNRVTADDFVMTHSDKWTIGQKPLLVDDKTSFGKRITNRSYLTYNLDSVKIEMHGDIAVTYGRYVASMRNVPPERVWFSVWYEKVYAKRNGQWIYLSHRTVNGANYGLDRASVSNR
jgi:hypothetical protein